MAEAAAGRWSREWGQVQNDRKVRGWNGREADRRNREFVDYDTRVPQGDTEAQ